MAVTANQEKTVKVPTDEKTKGALSADKPSSPSKKESDVAADAMMHLAKGKRNLVVNDIKAAVESLEQACSAFAEAYGETADECGESYYCYGSALLELARLETGVIGVGESSSKQEDSDDEPNINGDVPTQADKADAQKVEETKEDMETEETKVNGEVEKEDDDKENAAPADDVEDDQEEVEAEEDEEIPNLQLAWEVLELSKNIFYRQSKKSKEMESKLSETYLKLGEVSLESENYTQAIEDFCQCLFLRQKNLPAEDRKIAEVHYQLGNSYSFDKQYMKGKVQYDLSLKVLNQRIVKLKEAIAERKDDKNAAKTEEVEIEEIGKILPEIAEKISDMQELEKEVKITAAVSPRLVTAIRNTARAVSSLATEMRDTAQAKILEFGEGGSGSSDIKMDAEAAFSSPTKTSPAKTATTDISHLVKRKRDSLNGEGDAPKAATVAKSPTVKKVKVAEAAVVTNGTTNGTAVNGEA